MSVGKLFNVLNNGIRTKTDAIVTSIVTLLGVFGFIILVLVITGCLALIPLM